MLSLYFRGVLNWAAPIRESRTEHRPIVTVTLWRATQASRLGARRAGIPQRDFASLRKYALFAALTRTRIWTALWMCPELRRVARRQREPQRMGPRLLNTGSMAKEFAKKFYKSKAWQRTREAYAASVGRLCEDCLDAGIYNIGEIVHHRVEITPDNIDNPDITLNWDNLRLVCRDCHAKAHGSTKRFKVDAFGRVTAEG